MPLDSSASRAKVITRVVSQAPQGELGRTQVMKLIFFLQTLRGIDLGYRFTLFTYGPFDSEVLSDLFTARGLGHVTEETILYPRGYGYSIKPGPNANTISAELERQHPDCVAAIDETVREFGGLRAGELELRSTILFVDREFLAEGGEKPVDSLVNRVHGIKPHFDKSVIEERVLQMRGNGYLRGLSN